MWPTTARSVALRIINHVEIQSTEPSSSDCGQAAPIAPITGRAVALGFVFIIVGCWWGVYGEVVSQTDLTSLGMMMPPILTLLLLVMGNRLARRFCPPAVLSRAELITIYIMTNRR
ncbi:MAG: hypothetical protein LC772_13350 [Chloroflexi bacterium]|nr:hypothetical protein [Chloroflexota bacterium]